MAGSSNDPYQTNKPVLQEEDVAERKHKPQENKDPTEPLEVGEMSNL